MKRQGSGDGGGGDDGLVVFYDWPLPLQRPGLTIKYNDDAARRLFLLDPRHDV